MPLAGRELSEHLSEELITRRDELFGQLTSGACEPEVNASAVASVGPKTLDEISTYKDVHRACRTRGIETEAIGQISGTELALPLKDLQRVALGHGHTGAADLVTLEKAEASVEGLNEVTKLLNLS